MGNQIIRLMPFPAALETWKCSSAECLPTLTGGIHHPNDNQLQPKGETGIHCPHLDQNKWLLCHESDIFFLSCSIV